MDAAIATKDSADHGRLPNTLRILSYNIQAGVDTKRYREYVTKSWRHVLPHRERLHNLNNIAAMLSGYHVVGLQELDAGSLRSGFVDMTEYLAHRAGYPFWYHQVNRNIGPLARHSNGFLTHVRPSRVTHYKLPGGPGRGAMLLEFGEGPESLRICGLHLALGRRARGKQLDFISALLADSPNVVVMGDLNAGCDAQEMRRFVQDSGLREPACDQATFPSWRPVRRIDHILVSENLKVSAAHVVDYPLSDHLPISVELEIPESIR